MFMGPYCESSSRSIFSHLPVMPGWCPSLQEATACPGHQPISVKPGLDPRSLCFRKAQPSPLGPALPSIQAFGAESYSVWFFWSFQSTDLFFYCVDVLCVRSPGVVSADLQTSGNRALPRPSPEPPFPGIISSAWAEQCHRAGTRPAAAAVVQDVSSGGAGLLLLCGKNTISFLS